MASKTFFSVVLFVTLNLLFFCLIVNPVGVSASCPRNAVKMGACLKALYLGHVTVGTPPVVPCCSLVKGLVNLEAAACLCTTIKANILGIRLKLPVNLSMVLNGCGKKMPRGFQCA